MVHIHHWKAKCVDINLEKKAEKHLQFHFVFFNFFAAHLCVKPILRR